MCWKRECSVDKDGRSAAIKDNVYLSVSCLQTRVDGRGHEIYEYVNLCPCMKSSLSTLPHRKQRRSRPRPARTQCPLLEQGKLCDPEEGSPISLTLRIIGAVWQPPPSFRVVIGSLLTERRMVVSVCYVVVQPTCNATLVTAHIVTGDNTCLFRE